MSFLARSAVRKAFPAVARSLIVKRGFAEAVPADKLRLSLALPYTVCISPDLTLVFFQLSKPPIEINKIK